MDARGQRAVRPRRSSGQLRRFTGLRASRSRIRAGDCPLRSRACVPRWPNSVVCATGHPNDALIVCVTAPTRHAISCSPRDIGPLSPSRTPLFCARRRAFGASARCVRFGERWRHKTPSKLSSPATVSHGRCRARCWWGRLTAGRADAALDRNRRDCDSAALDQAMARLDREQREATQLVEPPGVPAEGAVAWLRELGKGVAGTRRRLCAS
jgi:hypothetical protein